MGDAERSRGIDVHAYPSPIRHESRMLKETWSLRERGLFSEIHLVGTLEEGLAERETLDETRSVWRVRLASRRGGGRLARLAGIGEWTWRVLRHYRRRDVRAFSAHNLASLPLGVLVKLTTGALLVYDTHELETERTGWNGVTRFLAKLAERALMPWVDLVVVVSESIGDWYRTRFPKQRLRVVRNIPLLDPPDGPVDPARDLRVFAGAPDGAIVYVMQGVLGEGRGIEILAEAFEKARTDCRLVLLGFTESGEYEERLRALLARSPKVSWHPSVRPDSILHYTRSADVGVYAVEPASLSYQLTVGNKLFEYLLAGIPVVGSDFPEITRILTRTGCGWTLPLEVGPLVDFIESLDRASLSEARERVLGVRDDLSWAREASAMIEDYETLLER